MHQMVNNHVPSSLHNALQDEVSSQLHRAAQQNPPGADIINTNGNKDYNNNDNGNGGGKQNGGAFKRLEDDSTDSWRELCRAFSSHFTTHKHQPKTIASLSNIIQGKEESLRDYIERFTREIIEVKGTNDKLKCYIFDKVLRSDTKFEEKLGLKEPQDIKTPPKKDERTSEDRGRRGPRGGYPEYTPLNATRERILQECINTEFPDAGIRPPREIKENPRTNRSKYCRFHKSAGHETED
ncbi:hypothetical protein A2U01_0002311 [Trifolium medium]|uniref:Retrotransposon gag domain-containing protein n=1 Tax=Trifolium medium TaxID=97028 RepID=A0A392M2H2_9FABA|nr:hypothetical protein [Trifolium medium]